MFYLIHDVKHSINDLSTITKDLSTKIDSVRTAVEDLRDRFKANVRGHPATANSALFIERNGHFFTCATMAYSARLDEAVIVTNLHAMVDITAGKNCYHDVTVLSPNKAVIGVSAWMVPEGDADIAIGRLVEATPIPALKITSKENAAVPGVQIWGMSLQETGMVALDGRVISTLDTPYRLMTNEGGVPGFSGTGYVDYTGALSVVHVGGKRPESATGAEEQKLAHFSDECVKGMRMATTAMASHIDACLQLVSANAVGARAIDAAGAAAIESKCTDGWKMLATGTISESQDFVEKCASIFAQRAVDHETVSDCKRGWSRECGRGCDFIGICLLFALGTPLDGQGGPATRDQCRASWYRKYAGFAGSCEQYTRLSARNPQAEAVAAWVVDEADFRFVDLSTRFPEPCTR